MRSRKVQAGIIIGALLTAMVIVALPRSAAASGWRHGFSRPYHSFHSRHRFRTFKHRFGRFHRGLHHHGFHRYRVYPQGLYRQKFRYTGPGYAFDHFKQGRDHHGYIRQGLGYGSSRIIIRR